MQQDVATKPYIYIIHVLGQPPTGWLAAPDISPEGERLSPDTGTPLRTNTVPVVERPSTPVGSVGVSSSPVKTTLQCGLPGLGTTYARTDTSMEEISWC
jgi:hypothetical protein